MPHFALVRPLAELYLADQLRNELNEAAIVATRRKGDTVTLDDFAVAIERIVAGLEKKSRVLGPEERRPRPSGWPLCTAYRRGIDTSHIIDMVPRGFAIPSVPPAV